MLMLSVALNMYIRSQKQSAKPSIRIHPCSFPAGSVRAPHFTFPRTCAQPAGTTVQSLVELPEPGYLLSRLSVAGQRGLMGRAAALTLSDRGQVKLSPANL